MIWANPKNVQLIGAILICFLCTLGIVISITKQKHNAGRIHVFITIFFALLLSQVAITEYLVNTSLFKISNKQVIDISLIIYIPIEVFILSQILYHSINSTIIKKYLLATPIFHSLFTIGCWFFLPPKIDILSYISTTESFLLIIPSIFYFYEIMNVPPILQLNNEPAFWTSTGILFLIITITPFFLLYPAIRPLTRQLIDFLGYTIIILLFIKASICSPKTRIVKFQL